ncbi:MAG: hypothetical protein U0930_01490 [Pirellulales bacterium]
MSSLRMSLLGIMPIVAVAALLCSEVRKSTSDTTDWRDVSVYGRGYIRTIDARGEKSIWFKSVHLDLNQQGELCVAWAGELRPIEPRIIVPTDWAKIEIRSDGQVIMNDSGSTGITIGSIPLTNFFGNVTKDRVTQEEVDNGLGPPFECSAGTQGTGQLIQFTEINYSLPLRLRVAVSLSLTVAYAAILVIWTVQKNLPQNERRIDSSAC